jgi:hypothetical protein
MCLTCLLCLLFLLCLVFLLCDSGFHDETQLSVGEKGDRYSSLRPLSERSVYTAGARTNIGHLFLRLRARQEKRGVAMARARLPHDISLASRPFQANELSRPSLS